MSKTSTKTIGLKNRNMGIHGTYQLKRELIECALHSEKTGTGQPSNEDYVAIGEVKRLRKQQHASKVVRVLSIDTGTKISGFVQTNHFAGEPPEIAEFGVLMNEDMTIHIRDLALDAIVMENFQCMGMPVGISTFNSAIWLGRFIEQFQMVIENHKPELVWLMHRSAVKMEICGTTRAKDANVRQAIIDCYTKNLGGGKCPQIGTTKDKGPLFGIGTHVWSALALAISFDKTVLAR